MHIVRRRPGHGSKSEHNVCADQSGEEHDLRRKKQPQTGLAVGNWQRRLILKFWSGIVTHITRCPSFIVGTITLQPSTAVPSSKSGKANWPATIAGPIDRRGESKIL